MRTLSIRKVRLFAVAALMMLLVASPVQANEISDRADTIAREQLESQQLVGLAIGLIVDGKIVHMGGYGFADREAGIAVDPSKTMFRWASISKPLTAIAAVQLWEQDKLDLDRDVREYVPEFPDKGHQITMRQLLGHQGGIVHYDKVRGTKRKYGDPNPFADVVNALDKFNRSKLLHEPGTAFRYTTHGYILASAVIQRAGEQAYHEQVAERIARPSGMKTLRPDYQWEEIPNRAVGYKSPKRRSSNTDVSWKLGGGGFLSTAEDLTLFAKALLERKLVSEQGYELLWTPQSTSDGSATTYGMGFNVGGEGDTYHIRHSGSQEKTRTLMIIFPGMKSALTIMTNSMYADVNELAQALLPLLLPAPEATSP